MTTHAGPGVNQVGSGETPSNQGLLSPLPRAVWRMRVAATCLVLTTLAFLQDPGMTAADTKLDLSQNPWAFLGRALSLWDERGFFGQLQNQAYGYLWPMGPFYGIGHSLGISPWVIQRLWWSLVLCVAFLGMLRLLRLLGVDNPWARLLGAVSFAVAPRILTTLGPTSVEAWPMAMSPWVLIPLVRGSLAGSPRRWAALSGLAFFCVGGVNAVATMAILPLGVLFLITRRGGPRRRSLAGWWVLAIGLASLWWLIPLVVLGKYSPPFLDWIESASITTSQADPTSALRGTSDWVAYLVGASGPLWQAGWTLVANPWVVVATGILAAAGAAGLVLRTTSERAFLVLSLLSGLTLTTLGHVGTPEGLGAPWVRALLDGSLAPLRNTHKFAPLIAFPLAVGVAACASVLFARWATTGRQRAGNCLLAVGLAAVVVAGAWPLVGGEVTRGRTFVEIPQYWREAAAWLDANADDGRALIVPGASFGDYLWGRTQDEPLQALTTRASWAVRDAVPLSSAGNIRLLDEIEARLESGEGSPGLADALARAGVRWLVVRNDLDPRATRQPPLALVHQALEQSPGFERVASFGPVLAPFRGTSLILNDGLDRAAPPIEVFRVGAADAAPLQARVVNSSRVRSLTGGPESLVGLADLGLIDADGVPESDPLIMVSDMPEGWSAGAAAPNIQSDSYRRSEVNFGSMRDQYSATYTEDESWRLARKVHDYALPNPTQSSVAAFEGVASIGASSSGSDPNAVVNRSPANQPWSALDGDPATAWRPGAVNSIPWWEVRFEQPLAVKELGLQVLGIPGIPTRVLITTDSGSQEVAVTDDKVTLPGTPTQFIRIEPVGQKATFGLREVTIPGLTAARSVVVPGGGGDGGLLFEARRGERSGCAAAQDVLTCSSSLPRAGEERAGIDRIVTVETGGTYRLSVRVRPRPGAALDRLLNSSGGIEVTASSAATSDPAGRAAAAFDLDPATTWVASPSDSRPTLTLALPEAEDVSGIKLALSPFAAASSPLKVLVTTDDGSREVILSKDGEASWTPTRTRSIALTFTLNAPLRSLVEGRAGSELLPVGVTELQVVGSRSSPAGLAPSAEAVSPCGFGPQVLVDGQVVGETSVRETVLGVTRGMLTEAVPCGDGEIVLAPGVHRIAVKSTPEWIVDAVALTSPQPDTDTATSTLSVLSTGSGQWRVENLSTSDQERVLSLNSNFNAGMEASEGDQTLRAIRLDGWRQGFIIPAGGSGDVQITFAPNTTYRTGLLLGLLAALILLALALLPGRRDTPPVSGRPRTALLAVGTVVCVALMTGLAGLALALVGYLVVKRTRRAWWWVAGSLVVGVATQTFAPWPERAGSGEVVQTLMALPVAFALGALLAGVVPGKSDSGDSATDTVAQAHTS